MNQKKTPALLIALAWLSVLIVVRNIQQAEAEEPGCDTVAFLHQYAELVMDDEFVVRVLADMEDGTTIENRIVWNESAGAWHQGVMYWRGEPSLDCEEYGQIFVDAIEDGLNDGWPTLRYLDEEVRQAVVRIYEFQRSGLSKMYMPVMGKGD